MTVLSIFQCTSVKLLQGKGLCYAMQICFTNLKDSCVTFLQVYSLEIRHQMIMENNLNHKYSYIYQNAGVISLTSINCLAFLISFTHAYPMPIPYTFLLWSAHISTLQWRPECAPAQGGRGTAVLTAAITHGISWRIESSPKTVTREPSRRSMLCTESTSTWKIQSGCFLKICSGARHLNQSKSTDKNTQRENESCTKVGGS